jgi:recombination protein RecA
MFGNPETTTGGNALKFYSSVRCEIRRAGNLKDGDTVIGSRTRVKVVKNKVAPPFQEAEFDIIYGHGVSRAGEVLDLGTNMGLIEKAGSFYSYQGERMAQGREKAIEWLKEHPSVMEELAQKMVATTPSSSPVTETQELAA